MKAVANYFAFTGQWSQFHILTIAAAVTGVLMVFTASELGPIAAFIIALGMYIIAFALLAQLLFWMRTGTKAIAVIYLRRTK